MRILQYILQHGQRNRFFPFSWWSFLLLCVCLEVLVIISQLSMLSNVGQWTLAYFETCPVGLVSEGNFHLSEMKIHLPKFCLVLIGSIFCSYNCF